MNFGVAAIEIGDLLERLRPGRRREIEFDDRAERFHGRGAGKIVERLIGGVLAEDRLLGGERFAGDFVGAIGGQPQFAAQRDGIVVARSDVYDAGAGPVVAVLLVITDANNYTQAARMDALILAQGAEGSLGSKLVHIGKTIFDVIGRGHIVHFELGFGAVQLFAHRFEQRIGLNRGGRRGGRWG